MSVPLVRANRYLIITIEILIVLPMDDVKGKILWVDDEIEMLRPHIRFLTERGYDVETAANGEDAVNLVRETGFDLVFLDEMMTGMGGLRTLAEIKEMRPNLPVVMVTKNEEESLMEEAIGVKISDYLTKPVNPSQILMACKKFLEGKKITSAAVSKDYIQEFNKISLQLMGGHSLSPYHLPNVEKHKPMDSEMLSNGITPGSFAVDLCLVALCIDSIWHIKELLLLEP